MTKPLVLVVEDEAPLVTLLRYNLEKEGFQVCEAGDGEEALVQIAECKPDIVLLDWMLPLVSGIEVCRRLRGGAVEPRRPAEPRRRAAAVRRRHDESHRAPRDARRQDNPSRPDRVPPIA